MEMSTCKAQQHVHVRLHDAVRVWWRARGHARAGSVRAGGQARALAGALQLMWLMWLVCAARHAAGPPPAHLLLQAAQQLSHALGDPLLHHCPVDLRGTAGGRTAHSAQAAQLQVRAGSRSGL